MAAARALMLLVPAAVFGATATACEREAAEQPGRRAAQPATPIALDGAGLGCLRIGAPLAALPGECSILGDRTIPGPEGMPERRVDILVAGDSVSATVVRDSVWRVEITTPRFLTGDGLGVGTAAARLLERPGSRVIGGEGRLFVTLDDRCGMSFEVGGLPPEVRALPAEAARGRIPAAAPVSRILLFGCEDPA